MSLKVHKIFIIAILWVIIVIIKFIFPTSIGDPHYNGYIVAIVSLILFLLRPNAKIAVISIFSFVILLFFSKGLLHPLGDLTMIVMTMCGFDIVFHDHLSKKESKILYYILLSFIVLSLAGITIPSLYSTEVEDGRRYDGLLHTGNVSSTVFCLCQIALYELKKSPISSRKYITSCLVSFGLIFLVSKTRTMIFFIPYWMAQSYRVFNKKLFYLGLLIGIIFVIQSLASLQAKLRFEEDGSYITRLYLYENLLSGILKSSLIPNGSYSATKLSKYITQNDSFAPHNDILMYLYDWGIIFCVLSLIIFKSYRKRDKFRWENFFIFIGWMSAGLHNTLLLPPVLFIYLLIINITINRTKRLRYEKNANTCRIGS